jgi:hypothetical protein
MELPELPFKLPRKGLLVEATGEKFPFTIVDEIRRPQSWFAAGTGAKILCLQLLRLDHNGKEELRLGYYIIGKKPRMLNKWVWGQFATMMPIEDFRALMNEAREKGWL